MYNITTLYSNHSHRSHCVASLYYEAKIIINESHSFKNSDAIIKEEESDNEYASSGKSFEFDEYRWPDNKIKFGKLRNLEYMKFGCAIELCLKADLLNKAYLVHTVNDKFKDLKDKQRKEPIPFTDVVEIAKFGTPVQDIINESKTIDFTIMTNKQTYLIESSMTTILTDKFDAIRRLRNRIHLPGVREINNIKSNPFKKVSDTIHFVKLLNDEIVNNYNRITQSNGLGYFPDINKPI